MSFSIENKMDRSIAVQQMNPLQNFVDYLTTYELHSPNEENIVVQRLKVLTASSNQYIGFKCFTDNNKINTYQVFSSHEHIPNNYKLGEILIDDILPVRSVVFTVNSDNTIKILDYSIYRVTHVSNVDFLAKMCISKNEDPISADTVMVDYLNANESYEGTVLVARHDETDGWIIRTTSCLAKDSYFASERSHYTMLTTIVPDVEEKLSELKHLVKDTYKREQDVYFVFVLVSSEQKYLCDYKSSKLILINIRDCDTHEDLPNDNKLTNWYDVPAVVSSDEVNSNLRLEDNEVFNDTYLDLQGYILKNVDGKLYRTFTLAYQYGLRKMPNHASMFINALHCYLRNSFTTFVKIKSISDKDAKLLAGHCKLVLNGIRNLFAYMFTVFTTLRVKQNEILNANAENADEENADEENADKKTTSKTFVKKNDILFKKVFNSSLPYIQTYARLLTIIQKYSLSSKMFKKSSELSMDVEKCLRILARNDNDFELFKDALHNYEMFKNHLVNSIVEHNKVQTQKFKVKLYNYTSEEMFLKVCSDRIPTNRYTKEVKDSIDL